MEQAPETLKHTPDQNELKSPHLPESLEKITLLPDEIARELDGFFNEYSQLQLDHQSLARELFDSYNHLNTTFNATLRVASCRSFPEAVETLLREIIASTGSCLSYYFGPNEDDFRGVYEYVENEYGVLVQTDEEEQRPQAQKYLRSYQDQLFGLCEEEHLQATLMLGYARADEPDYEGRGNVIALRLGNEEKDQQYLGTVIFVRTNQKEPYEAVDLNLARTLCRLGSAVLGNILYSRKISRMYLQIITSLVRAMEAKDQYTSGHSVRVAELACRLARYIGLSERDVENINHASQLHDIGKIGIRDEILQKPGRLTEEEFAHIKTHPEMSYKVLEPLDALKGIVAAVRHHHEHYDGSGYPDGLLGEAIPYHARILQIADIWDALTSTRSYRKAMADAEARKIMEKEAGKTMDPVLVEKFLEMISVWEQDSDKAIMF